MTPETDPVYLNYWRRKQLVARGTPHFPVLHWWPTPELSDVERFILGRVKDSATLLDVGAGDLTVINKLKAAGYSGVHHTQDTGREFQYSYSSLAEVTSSYSAILCLDVVEHLALADGLRLIHRLIEILASGGVLILQTPNSRSVRSPLSSDMTHRHGYNLPDLWSYLTCLGMSVEGFRVVLGPSRPTPLKALLALPSRFVITRLLGLDYADNILLVARKP